MKKKDELANPNSCLNRAAKDEPLFVLRANDPQAPQIVRAWAGNYLCSKSPATQENLNKYNEALLCAQDMEDWRRLHVTAK